MKNNPQKSMSIKPMLIKPIPNKLRQLTVSISLIMLASVAAKSAEFVVITDGDQGDGSPNEISPNVFEINTLRSAIKLADDENAFPGADTISFDNRLFKNNQALISLNRVGDTYQNLGSSSNSALGINSEIIIQGPADAELILRPNNMRHFQVNAGGQLNLNHVTLDGGNSPNNLSGNGGSVLVKNGGLRIKNSTLSNNTAQSGGALSFRDGTGQSMIINTLFKNNETIKSAIGGEGGAVRSIGDTVLAIKNSQFSGNVSNKNGGALYAGGTLNVESSTFVHNVARRNGGAIFVSGGSAFTMKNATISFNTAKLGDGGGVLSVVEPVAGDSNTVFINSTISHNQSSTEKSVSSVVSARLGGLVFDSSGGGIFGEYADSFLLHNTVIANNTEFIEQIPDDVAAVINSDSSHNLIGAGFSLFGLTDGINGNQIGSRDVPIDVQLQSLADNGGGTLTQLPDSSSPVVDAGNEEFCEITDQRGRIRPQDGDEDGSAVCDIGAVELGDVTDLIFNNGFNDLDVSDIIFINSFEN